MSKLFATLVLAAAAVWRPAAAPLTVPNRPDTFKFAVLGDNGSGDSGQMDLARQMAAGRARIVTVEKSRLVDRAWSAVMGALGHLVGNNTHAETHA